MKLFWSLIALIAVSIVTAWYLMNFIYITDEERILRIIERSRVSFVSGSASAINGMLAPEYSHAGGMDRSMVTRALYQLFSETENREIQIINTDIQINQDTASVSVYFLFDAKFSTPNSMFQKFLAETSNDNKHGLLVQLRKYSSDWKIYQTAPLASR